MGSTEALFDSLIKDFTLNVNTSRKEPRFLFVRERIVVLRLIRLRHENPRRGDAPPAPQSLPHMLLCKAETSECRSERRFKTLTALKRETSGQASAPISRPTLCEQWWLFNGNVSSVRSACDRAGSGQPRGRCLLTLAPWRRSALPRRPLAAGRFACSAQPRRGGRIAPSGPRLAAAVVSRGLAKDVGARLALRNGALAVAPHRMQRLMVGGTSRVFSCSGGGALRSPVDGGLERSTVGGRACVPRRSSRPRIDTACQPLHRGTLRPPTPPLRTGFARRPLPLPHAVLPT
ncbi:unnamed protein product [Leptosia nina]|uniref:Uncharacterized protein n=1 Tax=Leptosia nina TaxID=320188 RepID=A0AAV1JYV6_9NEOP